MIHPLALSEHGMYMLDCKELPLINVNITGFTGMLATRILGEVWTDNYIGYEYTEGDENYVEIIMISDCSYEDEFDIYTEDEDGE